MASRQRFLAIVIAVLFLAGGCRNTTPPTTVNGSSPSRSAERTQHDQARTEAQQPPEQEEQPDPYTQAIEALSRRTISHAQDMEELLSRRQAEPRTSEQMRDEMDVEWMEPDEPSAVTEVPTIDEPQANVATPTRLSQEDAAASTERSGGAASANASAAVAIAPGSSQRSHDIDEDDGPVILPLEADHDLPLPRDRAHTDRLHERLARHIREYPRDTAGHLEYQLLQFLRGEQVPQLSAIAALPAEDRELLVALLDGLSNFHSTLRADNNMLLSRKVRPLLQMSDRLRTQADLHIPTIALCTRVDGFGVYQPIEPTRFAAGQAHDLIVYCEVQNFSSQMNDDRRWETRLAQEVVLYTDNGMGVWQEPVHTVSDLSRNRRNDFFVVTPVRLPSSLTIGQYVLKVTIRDEHAGRVAEASLPVQIVSR